MDLPLSIYITLSLILLSPCSASLRDSQPALPSAASSSSVPTNFCTDNNREPWPSNNRLGNNLLRPPERQNPPYKARCDLFNPVHLPAVVSRDVITEARGCVMPPAHMMFNGLCRQVIFGIPRSSHPMPSPVAILMPYTYTLKAVMNCIQLRVLQLTSLCAGLGSFQLVLPHLAPCAGM